MLKVKGAIRMKALLQKLNDFLLSISTKENE